MVSIAVRRTISHSWSLSSTCLPLKRPSRIGRTSAYPSLHQPSRSMSAPTSYSHQTNTMPKTTESAAPQSPSKWQLVSWAKKDEQYARIPLEWRLTSLPSPDSTNYIDVPRKCGLLTQHEIAITQEYDATALAEAIRSRKLKCVDVARAFCKVRIR